MALPLRKIATFLCVFFFAWFFLRFALPVCLPFLLGGALALVSEPAASRLSGLRVPRSVAAAISVTMSLGVVCIGVLALGSLLIRKLSALSGVLPDMAGMVMSGIDALQSWLSGLTLRLPAEVGQPIRNAILGFSKSGAALLEQGVKYTLGLAGGMLCAIPGSALSFATALIAAYMISSEMEKIKRFLAAKIPAEKQESWKRKIMALRKNALMWFLSQAKLSAVTLGILTVGFLFLRIPFGIGWALVICLVDALPVLGIGTVLIPWSLIAFLQGDPARAAGLLGLYITSALVRSVLEPKFVGSHLGLDPLVTLFALYGGFRLWGVAGMMVMPMVAVGAVSAIREE